MYELRNELSEKEIEMFKALYLKWLLDFPVFVTSAYKTAVEHCFLAGLSGPAVESLKRTASAFLVLGKPHRMTAEFDALINLATEPGLDLQTFGEAHSEEIKGSDDV